MVDTLLHVRQSYSYMKFLACSLLTSFALLFFAHAGVESLPIDEPDNKRTVTFSIEEEDATSTFYYFFYSLPDADQVSKVRMLWNGGARNKPAITDYYLCGTFIWIVERSAERGDLPLLQRGEDASFHTIRERFIKTVPVESQRGYTFPEVTEVPHLSVAEHKELETIISLLSKTRKPIQSHSR